MVIDPTKCPTTVELLAEVADAFGDHDAYVEASGRRLSFGDWDRAAEGTAQAFAELGVKVGDVVALVLPSGADYAVCYQAAMRLGAITTGINPRLGAGEVSSILTRATPRLMVIDDDYRLDGPAGTRLARSQLAALRTLGPCASRCAPDPEREVAVVWTSGTTGAPKGVVFAHRNLRAVAESAGSLGGPFDRRISSTPFSHVAYMTHLWEEIGQVMTTVINPTPWKAAEALRLMDRERVTVGQGVPSQWRLMLDHPDFEGTDLSDLRIAGTGAAPVPPDLIREMQERLGCAVVIGYASTEAALISGSSPGDRPEVIARTVGRPRAQVEVQVSGPAGPLPVGETGIVRCRSAAVMKGYWRDPAATAAAIDREGWLSTGDLGRFDEHGYLTLVGRLNEMYLRGAYNVYPVEVERILSQHPTVGAVAVVAKADPVLGDVGVAFVVPAAGAEPTLGELRAWCKRHLADYKAPDVVSVLSELPLTAMGKVDKQSLSARAGALPPLR